MYCSLSLSSTKLAATSLAALMSACSKCNISGRCHVGNSVLLWKQYLRADRQNVPKKRHAQRQLAVAAAAPAAAG